MRNGIQAKSSATQPGKKMARGHYNPGAIRRFFAARITEMRVPHPQAMRVRPKGILLRKGNRSVGNLLVDPSVSHAKIAPNGSAPFQNVIANPKSPGRTLPGATEEKTTQPVSPVSVVFAQPIISEKTKRDVPNARRADPSTEAISRGLKMGRGRHRKAPIHEGPERSPLLPVREERRHMVSLRRNPPGKNDRSVNHL